MDGKKNFLCVCHFWKRSFVLVVIVVTRIISFSAFQSKVFKHLSPRDNTIMRVGEPIDSYNISWSCGWMTSSVEHRVVAFENEKIQEKWVSHAAGAQPPKKDPPKTEKTFALYARILISKKRNYNNKKRRLYTYFLCVSCYFGCVSALKFFNKDSEIKNARTTPQKTVKLLSRRIKQKFSLCKNLACESRTFSGV